MSRARVRYSSDNPSPVELPGSIQATPSIVRPGDVVEVDESALEVMLAEDEDGNRVDDRWTEVDDDTPIAGPYDQLNASELRDELDERGIDRSGLRSNADMRAALEAADRANPPVPEAPADELAASDDDEEHNA